MESQAEVVDRLFVQLRRTRRIVGVLAVAVIALVADTAYHVLRPPQAIVLSDGTSRLELTPAKIVLTYKDHDTLIEAEQILIRSAGKDAAIASLGANELRVASQVKGAASLSVGKDLAVLDLSNGADSRATLLAGDHAALTIDSLPGSISAYASPHGAVLWGGTAKPFELGDGRDAAIGGRPASNPAAP